MGLKEIWKDKEPEADGGEDGDAGRGASCCLMQPLWQFGSVFSLWLTAVEAALLLISSLQHENPFPDRRPLTDLFYAG